MPKRNMPVLANTPAPTNQQMRDELQNKSRRLMAEIRSLESVADRSDGQNERIENLRVAEKRTRDEWRAMTTDRVMSGAGRVERGHDLAGRKDDHDAQLNRAASPIGEALRSIEGNRWITDDQKQGAVVATESLARTDERFAAYARATGSADYLTAFGKLLADPDNGHRNWTDTEQRAFTTAQTEARSLAIGTDATGGFAVPLALDPSVLRTDDGALNPMRAAARVVQITNSDVWQGVVSDGVSARWAPEATEANDDSPTLAGPSIKAHKADSFVPFSIEVGADWARLASEVGMMMADAREVLEGEAFINGDGVDKPMGLVADLAANGAAQSVAVAGAGVLAAADIRSLWASLPSRYRRRAVWLTDAARLAEVQALGNGADSDFTTDFTADGVQRLIGRLTIEDDAITGSAADLVFGDFSNYVIVDRVGMRVELVPHLTGANGRPTGQRGLYCYWRTGGAPVNRKGFRWMAV